MTGTCWPLGHVGPRNAITLGRAERSCLRCREAKGYGLHIDANLTFNVVRFAPHRRFVLFLKK